MHYNSHSPVSVFVCPTCSPVLWGQAAVERQEVSEVLGPSLHKQASTQSILEQLNPALMHQSILNFPVRRAHSVRALTAGCLSLFVIYTVIYDAIYTVIYDVIYTVIDSVI